MRTIEEVAHDLVITRRVLEATDYVNVANANVADLINLEVRRERLKRQIDALTEEMTTAVMVDNLTSEMGIIRAGDIVEA